jgi:uncharacterized protein (TIGR00369 family)
LKPFTPFDQTPVNQLLGLRLVEARPERSVVELAEPARVLQEAGLVQGGVIASLADVAAARLFVGDLEPGQSMTTLELSIRYLRPGLPEAGPLRAVGTPIKRGRRTAVAEVSVNQGERELARVATTLLFVSRD